MTTRICLALDLVDDAALIAEYEDWHRVGRTDPAVLRSIRAAGIDGMEIYRAGTRLFMVIDANDDYDPDRKAAADAANPAVVAWVERMRQFQQPIPAAGADGSWHVMETIFRLGDHPDG
ncbi:L-rhamnose mutarotase [Sphingomonas montana]|uniref:L-rhamnose mutarotase n=1 Tax=Sphingomonas montana TaxID=1843236 RepID=UPI00096C4DDB|nr:L-rhamnose mutarotase [Sphingomonas montana]